MPYPVPFRPNTPRGNPLRRVIAPLLLVIAAVVGTGCEEAVYPIIETDRRYSVYGTLDMNSDRQMVRVIPIRETIFGDPGELNVEVRSIDLQNGKEYAWRDSVVTFPDGLVGHVFVTQKRIESLHRYRLEILEPDGEVVTWAETTVPLRPRATVARPTVATSPQGYVALQRLQWADLPKYPFEVTYWYRFFSYRGNRFVDVAMPHVPGNAKSLDVANAWDFVVDLVADRSVLDEEYPQWRGDPLAGIGMTVTLLDDAFVPPGGKFDREVLSEPGTFNNVEGGFGFVGSVGRFSAEWVLPDSTARVLGYNPLGGALRALHAQTLTAEGTELVTVR